MCFLMLDYTRILITHQHHLKEGIVHVWVGLDDLKNRLSFGVSRRKLLKIR